MKFWQNIMLNDLSRGKILEYTKYGILEGGITKFQTLRLQPLSFKTPSDYGNTTLVFIDKSPT